MRLASVGQLRRVERLRARVLVEQLLELRELVVGLRAHHRRHEVVDHDGVGAALGLHPLAGIVDHERVEERDVAEAGVGRAGGRQARAPCPAATPACRACRGARSRRRRTRCRASGRSRGSGGRARAAGRGRSRPGSRRSRAAAGWRRRRCRARGPRSRNRRPRRTSRRAAGPRSRRSGRAARPAACRTTRRSRRSAAAPSRPRSWVSLRNSWSWPPVAISAWMSSSPSANECSTWWPAALSASSRTMALKRACRARPRCPRARAWWGTTRA